MKKRYTVSPTHIGDTPYFEIYLVSEPEGFFEHFVGAPGRRWVGFAATQAEADKKIAHHKTITRSIPA